MTMAWNACCVPIKLSGLGIKSFNKSMVGKFNLENIE